VKDRGQLDACIAQTIASGGRLIERGEHAKGVPFAYVADPDGYVIEIWPARAWMCTAHRQPTTENRRPRTDKRQPMVELGD
jgi:hypothetical protein